jgi:hypothetical protein
VQGAAGRAAEVDVVSPQVWGSLFLTLGAAVLLYGASLFFEKLRFVRRAVEAPGTVVRRVAGAPAGLWRPECYHPVIRFTTEDGLQVVFQSAETMLDLACRVGSELPILYERTDPERARIGLRKWYDVFMTVYLGVFVSAAGLALTTGLARLSP